MCEASAHLQPGSLRKWPIGGTKQCTVLLLQTTTLSRGAAGMDIGMALLSQTGENQFLGSHFSLLHPLRKALDCYAYV